MFIRIIFMIGFLMFVFSGFLYAQEKLVVFHAGSLSIPFKEMEKAFEKKYPNIDVQRESSGSRTAARKVSDLHRPCDIVASADYTVIDELLIPEYAAWNIRFVTNEMAIMYGAHSKYRKKINADNWHKILLKLNVEYGYSDPNVDPCGYRSLLVWQLAEKYYKQKNLYDKLIKGCSEKNIRPKETDLIALLEAGELDYLFIYKSVAMQHHSAFIELPAEISLKDNTYDDFYKQASIEITGKNPGTYITKKGQAMVYAMTIPKNAPNYEMALKFVDFVLSEEGREIMKKNGQGTIIPAQSSQIDEVPESLKKYLR